MSARHATFFPQSEGCQSRPARFFPFGFNIFIIINAKITQILASLETKAIPYMI